MYEGGMPDLIDSRDLIEFARDNVNRRDDPDTCASIDNLTLQEIEDWEYGATLIKASYFTEYAEEYAKDTGEVSDTDRWPYCHIDWEAAAESLLSDFSCVEFLGIDYYVR